MRTIVALTVITLFALATARCADAGVMLGDSPAVIAQDASSLSADLTPLQKEEQKRGSFHQGESSAMYGFSISVSQTVVQSATGASFENLIQQPPLLGLLGISNEALPVSPELDSLLKPS
ncbi:MAG TPA: hypothetical protein DDZ51_25170 [Planctomycetaceae bacterium]|nr:hypothetical protein [Planctomycetaceae bacterium]